MHYYQYVNIKENVILSIDMLWAPDWTDLAQFEIQMGCTSFERVRASRL